MYITAACSSVVLPVLARPLPHGRTSAPSLPHHVPLLHPRHLQVKSALRRVPSAVQRLTAAHATAHFHISRMRASGQGTSGSRNSGADVQGRAEVTAPPLVVALQALMAQQSGHQQQAAHQAALAQEKLQWLQTAASNIAMLLECLHATLAPPSGGSGQAGGMNDGMTAAGGVYAGEQVPDRALAKDQAARWRKAGQGMVF